MSISTYIATATAAVSTFETSIKNQIDKIKGQPATPPGSAASAGGATTPPAQTAELTLAQTMEAMQTISMNSQQISQISNGLNKVMDTLTTISRGN